MQTEGDIAAIRYNLGDRIRLIRKGQKISQYTFAEMIDLDRSFIIGIEKGRRNPTFGSLCKIAQGFGISLSELCEGIDERASIDVRLELMRQLMEEEKAKKAAEASQKDDGSEASCEPMDDASEA